ncbi:MAG: hypothetical protein IID45_12425, partial [Planctomycetes bacterium]|nr:hypothetical protein [Planctomycetota bacterium]
MVPEVLRNPQSDGSLLGTRVTRNIRIETAVTDQFTNFVPEPVMTTDLQESQAVEAAESFVLDKTTEISAAAREAFEQQDYAAVVRRLEQIPESFLSSEDHVLLNRARHYRHIETKYAEAKLLVEREQFEMALRALAQIPESDRNEECLRLMSFARNHARIAPLIIAADHCLKSQDYEEVVRIFEEIPIESRTDELITRLSTAHSRIRQLSDARA